MYNIGERYPEFNLRNFDLVLLPAETAADIENSMNSRDYETESVSQLSKLLNDATKGDDPVALFPENCFVLCYAISGRKNFEKYWKGKTHPELLLQVNLVAKELRDFNKLPPERQKNLTGFCIRLSREIMSYQAKYIGGPRLVA